MPSVGVVVTHPDPSVVRALVESIDACDDLYVAGTDTSIPAGVIIAGGEALEHLRAPLVSPVVALAHSGDEIRAARCALAIGAREIIRWPDEAFRVPGAARLAAADAGVKHGRVVAVIGARGGAGVTTATLFFAISSGGIAVDFAGGGLDLLEKDPPESAPISVASADVVRDALDPLDDHARILRASRVSSDHSGILLAARQLGEDVIVDGGRDGGSSDACDLTVVVCADDVISARGLKSVLAEGVSPDLILVRRERRNGCAARDIAAAAPGVPWVLVPRDIALARSLDLGRIPERRTRGVRAYQRAWHTVSA